MGRFIAEPLGEQPIGSEGSSWPALRTYLLGYILREPQSTSANLLDDVGGERGGWGFVLRWRYTPRWVSYANLGRVDS